MTPSGRLPLGLGEEPHIRIGPAVPQRLPRARESQTRTGSTNSQRRWQAFVRPRPQEGHGVRVTEAPQSLSSHRLLSNS